MANDLQRHVEYAEYLLQCCRDQPSLLIDRKSGESSKSKSIQDKLLDLYLEEKEKQNDDSELDTSTYLLAKLVKRDKLNCLVLNLYPANEGYSLMLKARNGIETETIKLPYEESELLEYVDEAQLPPFLVDLLEKSNLNVFYSGCVIVEVRDYRRSAIGSHDSQYVLLRPTSQSLLCDINALMSENENLVTQEDEFMIESEILLATEEPLCLDPSPAVCLINNRIQFEDKTLCNPDLKRTVKKFSQVSVNRKRKLAQAPAPKELKLFDFITRKKDKNKVTVGSKPTTKAKSCVDYWRQKNPINLTTPSVIEVEKYSKVIEKPQSGVEYPKVFVEEHTLEREPNQEKHMLARVTILRRSSDDVYFGELYLDYEYSTDKKDGGRSCHFLLGSREEVDKYLDQFRQLFTEEGRRLVKITVKKPNAPPSTTYTQTPQGVSNISIAQAFLQQATGLTATLSSQGQGDGSTGSNLASKRNMPIQLSLSIAHPLSSQSNNVINQQPNITLPSPGSLPGSNQNSAGVQQVPVLQSPVNQPLSGTQKMKQPIPPATPRMSISNKTPTVSPATTPTHQPSGFMGINVSQSNPPVLQKAPTPSLTPPPNSRTPTPTRKDTQQSVTTSNIQALNLNTYIQVSTSDSNISAPAPQQQNVGTNINITNIGGLPQNFNIQGLTAIPGMNIANLQGLQNMQVSLTGVPGGAIAVPISMINSNPSIIQNQAGLFVSSLPNLSTSTSSTDQLQSISSIAPHSQNLNTSVTSPSGLVTMVTGLQTTTPPVINTTSIVSSPQVIMSTGPTSSNPNSTGVVGSGVIPQQSSNMLSLPIGLQYLPVSSKNQASTGLRPSASMPLLQLPGQQSIQLLNLPQQRAQIKGSIGQGQGNIGRGQPGTSNIPISNVITQSTMATISQLNMGKTVQAGQGTITPQQFMQLTSGSNIQPASQIPTTQLTFQKAPQNQPLQFHHLQVKPGTPLTSQKPKCKKQPTLTPPK